MTQAKPDCTGEIFGFLIVLGKGGRKQRGNSYRQLWKLRCHCGKVIEKPRGYFDRKDKKGQTSCGCRRRNGFVDNKRRPKNITGEKFSKLTAIALTGKKDNSKKPTWLFICDCGQSREMSLTALNGLLRSGTKVISCGDKNIHKDKWFHYPETPDLLPIETKLIIEKYVGLTKSKKRYTYVRQDIEDEKIDRLIRAAWIITCRRKNGEDISELHEKRLINKNLRYCSIDVFWKNKIEQYGGFIISAEDKIKQIGIKMTNQTSQSYPVIETLGNSNLFANNVKSKKIRFKRR